MLVPHLFQSSEQTCGAVCLRMLFAALSTALDEGIIAQSCGVTPFGCPIQDLITGAQALGFSAVLLPISTETEAIAALSNDVPFVVMIDLSNLYGGPMFQWHFVVALGLAQGDVSFHLPSGRIAGPHWTTSLLPGARPVTEECAYGPRNSCPGLFAGQHRAHDPPRASVV